MRCEAVNVTGDRCRRKATDWIRWMGCETYVCAQHARYLLYEPSSAQAEPLAGGAPKQEGSS